MINLTILEGARDGDREDFIAIFHHYRQKVYNTAYFILKDHQYADDVVQETLLQVHLKIRKLSSLEAFESWLYKIAVNLCLKLLKKTKKLSTVAFNDEIDNNETNDMDGLDSMIVEQELVADMMNCIYLLPDKHRVVITLFYFNEMSVKDISEVLGCSEGTVKSRLFYAKKILRTTFNQKYCKAYETHEGGAVHEL